MDVPPVKLGKIGRAFKAYCDKKSQSNLQELIHRINIRFGYGHSSFHEIAYLDQKRHLKGIYYLYLQNEVAIKKKREKINERESKMKPITPTLKKGDIIIDEEDTEWIVLEDSNNQDETTIRKKRGKIEKTIQLEGTAWASIPDERDENADGDVKESWEALQFEEMF